jgi:hypothetical protein
LFEERRDGRRRVENRTEEKRREEKRKGSTTTATRTPTKDVLHAMKAQLHSHCGSVLVGRASRSRAYTCPIRREEKRTEEKAEEKRVLSPSHG